MGDSVWLWLGWSGCKCGLYAAWTWSARWGGSNKLIANFNTPLYITATQLNNLGPGEGPILLSNVNCNQNHSQLSQCVHPLSIDIHNCHQNSTAGVTCLGGTYSSITDITSRTSSAFTTAVTHTNYQVCTEGGDKRENGHTIILLSFCSNRHCCQQYLE